MSKKYTHTSEMTDPN